MLTVVIRIKFAGLHNRKKLMRFIERPEEGKGLKLRVNEIDRSVADFGAMIVQKKS